MIRNAMNAAAVLEMLRDLASPEVPAQMGPRFGIHSDDALGVTMSDMSSGTGRQPPARPEK